MVILTPNSPEEAIKLHQKQKIQNQEGVLFAGEFLTFVAARWNSRLLQPIIETERDDLVYLGVFFEVRMTGVKQKVLVWAIGEEHRGNKEAQRGG